MYRTCLSQFVGFWGCTILLMRDARASLSIILDCSTTTSSTGIVSFELRIMKGNQRGNTTFVQVRCGHSPLKVFSLATELIFYGKVCDKVCCSCVLRCQQPIRFFMVRIRYDKSSLVVPVVHFFTTVSKIICRCNGDLRISMRSCGK